MAQVKQSFIASAVISELQSSDIYLTVKARLFDLRANLNGVRVTSAFLDEIVEHQDKYVCIPVCADVRGLLNNKTVGHMYDAKRGEFHSTQIGSFYQFEREDDGDNSYLIGYARIMKRNKAVCEVIAKLFAENKLKFSFEISCGKYTIDEDDHMVIDAHDSNFLEGVAIVTFPACEEAVAMDLVAEVLSEGDENAVDNAMENTIETLNAEADEAKDAQTVQAETEPETVEAEAVEPEAVETVASEDSESADAQAEEAVAEDANAERVYVEQTHVEHDSTQVWHDDGGMESITTTTEARVSMPVEMSEELVAEGESAPAEGGDTPSEGDATSDDGAAAASDDNAHKDKMGSNEQIDISSLASAFAELQSAVQALTAEIATMKQEAGNKLMQTASDENASEEVQDKVTVDAEQVLINPFIAEISTPTKKYALLEKAEKPSSYSLLERA